MKKASALLLRFLLLLPLTPLLGCDNGQVTPAVQYVPVNPAQNNGAPFRVVVIQTFEDDDDDDDDDF